MNPIRIDRSPDFRTTIINISSDAGHITIRVEGRWNPKQRRTIGRIIFVQLKPILGFLRRVYLHHLEHWPFDYHRAEERGLNTFKSADFRTENAKFGLCLRLSRQKKNLSLRQFSEQIGIAANHLSRIERGLHTPHFSTFKKLSEFINS